MAKERVRVTMPDIPTPDYWTEKAREGWKLVAVEWERDTEDGQDSYQEQVPYGLKVGDDCHHLVENPMEMEALAVMRECIIADKPLSEVASVLNDRGFQTRSGQDWNQVDVYDLLPRQVDATRRIHEVENWEARRREALKIVR